MERCLVPGDRGQTGPRCGTSACRDLCTLSKQCWGRWGRASRGRGCGEGIRVRVRDAVGQSRADEARHALSWMFYYLARRSPSCWGAAGAGRARAGAAGLEVELEGFGDARLQLGELGQRGRQPRHAPLLPGHGARAVVGLELDAHFPQQPWAGGEGSGSAARPAAPGPHVAVWDHGQQGSAHPTPPQSSLMLSLPPPLRSKTPTPCPSHPFSTSPCITPLPPSPC